MAAKKAAKKKRPRVVTKRISKGPAYPVKTPKGTRLVRLKPMKCGVCALTRAVFLRLLDIDLALVGAYSVGLDDKMSRGKSIAARMCPQHKKDFDACMGETARLRAARSTTAPRTGG